MGRELRWRKMHGYILVLYHLCMLWAWIRRHAWGGAGVEWLVLLWQHLVCGNRSVLTSLLVTVGELAQVSGSEMVLGLH